MTDAQKAMKLLEENHGYLTSRSARAQGIHLSALTRLTQQGHVARAAQGLYVLADILPDPLIVAQHRFAQGVFSHETALYLHDFSDRVPLRMMMTVPSGWGSPYQTDPDMQFFYRKRSKFEMGLSRVPTKAGPQIRCYDLERTICDCVYDINKLDRDIVMTALKKYMKSKESKPSKLLSCAQTMGIRDKIFQYMEVLS